MGLTLDADRCRRARSPHRGMDRRPAARGALDAGPRRHRRRSSPSSPATTASSSTTSPRRCSTARAHEVRELPARDVDPRAGSPGRCATPSPAERAARPCSSSSTGPTSSSSRSTIAAPGTATTTSSPTCSGPACWTSDPDRVAELHRRASDWYEAHGDRAEAISHALAGERLRARRAAHRAGCPGDAAGAARRPRSGAGSKPCPTRSSATGPCSPSGWWVHGWRPATPAVWSRCSSWSSRRWSPRPRPPDRLRRATSSPGFPPSSSMYRAGLALLAGDLDGTIAHATRVLDLAEPTDHLHRAPPQRCIGLAHWTTGDLETAERCYAEAVASFIAAEYLPDVLGCSLALADIQIAQGRLGDASRTFESGLRWTAEHPGLRGAADMHVGLSEVLIERNDLDAAARHLQVSDELGEHAGLPQNAYRWRVATARLHCARGDLDGAARPARRGGAPLQHRLLPARPSGRGAPGEGRSWHAATSPRRAAGQPTAGSPPTTSSATSASSNTSPSPACSSLSTPSSTTPARSRRRSRCCTGCSPPPRKGTATGSAIEILTLLAAAHHARGDVAGGNRRVGGCASTSRAGGLRPRLPRRRPDHGGAPARAMAEHRAARRAGAGRMDTSPHSLRRRHPLG